MLVASGSPLVAGAVQRNMATQSQSAQRKIRVNRAFMYDGRRREIGEEIVIPTLLAFELYTARRAESADNEPSEEHQRCKAEAQAKAKAKAAKLKVAVAA